MEDFFFSTVSTPIAGIFSLLVVLLIWRVVPNPLPED